MPRTAKRSETIFEDEESRPKRKATTPEARENQMIALAMDLVERRLREGTASAQETTHFLKLASTKSRMEVEMLELQKELVAAKTEALQTSKHIEEMYAEAMNAFRSYSGQAVEPDE